MDLCRGDTEIDQDEEPDHVGTDVGVTNILTDHVSLGKVFEALLSRDFVGKLSRYEMSLQRQLTMTLKELRQLADGGPDESEQLRSQSDSKPESGHRVRVLRRA